MTEEMRREIEIVGKRTNFGKYKDSILDWIDEEQVNRFCIKDKMLIVCNVYEGVGDCRGCEFLSEDGCQYTVALKTLKWLFDTPRVEITLTTSERKFCESVNQGYVSRVGTGALFWSIDKPVLYSSKDGLIFSESGHIMFPDNIVNQWEIFFHFIEKGQSYKVQDLLQRDTGV